MVVATLRWAGISLLASGLAGCGNCSDATDRASNFFRTPANLVCQSDDDCAVVSTGCARPARALCGAAALNAKAASSDAWKDISEDLDDCGDSCDVCGAALLPQCVDGFCGGKP